jgi:hypothetical protein
MGQIVATKASDKSSLNVENSLPFIVFKVFSIVELMTKE